MIWFFRTSVVAYFAAVAYAAVTYPAEIPVHFDVSGVADKFLEKTAAVVVMTSIGVLLVALLSLVGGRLTRGSLHNVNIPHKAYWTRPENLPTTRLMLRDDLAWIAGCTMSLLTAIIVVAVSVSDKPFPALGTPGRVALFAFLLAVGGRIVHMYTWRYRPKS